MDPHINYVYVKRFVFITTLGMYLYLFYGIMQCQYLSDFTSFYASASAAKQGNNPYLSLMVDYTRIIGSTSINVNPPIVFILFLPLTFLSYPIAVSVWALLSLAAALIGGWYAIKIAFSESIIKKYWLMFILVYLLLFHNQLNFFLVQLGGLLVVCIIPGYYFYLKKKDYVAGILWGLIIGLKFFPGLLLVFVLKEKRKKVLASMLLTIGCCFLLPLFVYGPTMFQQFIKTLESISWYHFSWNASLLGFLHAVFYPLKRFEWIAPIYVLVSFVLLIGYMLILQPNKEGDEVNHQGFCLTLVLMLMLCPLGWVYYFPILLLPVSLLWAGFMNEREPMSKSAVIWLIAIFCLNYPLSRYLGTQPMKYHGINSIIPINFVGLAILFTLLTIKRAFLIRYQELRFDTTKNGFILFSALIVAFSFTLRSIAVSIYLARICGI